MKKTRKLIKKTEPVDRYEDYLAIKQREQQESDALEAMMSAAQDEAVEERWQAPSDDEYIPIRTGISDRSGEPAFEGMVPAPPPGIKALGTSGQKKAKRSSQSRPTSSSRSSRSGRASVIGMSSMSGPTGPSGQGYPTRVQGVGYSGQYGVGKGRDFIEPTLRTDEEEGDPLPELEAADAKLPADIEKFDIIRSSFKIFRVPERTLIYVVVKDKQDEKNVIANLRCYGGIAFGGYARDTSNDAYLVECVEAAHLATVPFSLRLGMPGTDSWSMEVPIPEKVLEKVFSPNQRKTLESLRERFPQDRYEIHYLQMSLSN